MSYDVTLPKRLRLRLEANYTRPTWFGNIKGASTIGPPLLVLQVGYVDSGILLGSTQETVDERYVHYRDAEVSDLSGEWLKLLHDS